MVIISLLAFFVVIFLLAAIAVAVAWMTFVKQAEERVEVAEPQSDPFEESEDEPNVYAASYDEPSSLLLSEKFSTLGFWNTLLHRFDFVEILKERLQQAGLDWSVGRITLLMLLAGTSVLLFLERALPIVAPFAAVGAAFAPYAYIMQRRKKRFERFQEGFPDMLDSLARALRSGYSLSAAMEATAGEANPVVAVEMWKAATEVNLGMSWGQALKNLGKRVPLIEVDLFAAAVTLHSRTGGRLSEVVSGLAENMREASSLRGEVRALAAHGKLTGLILTILPIGIAAVMMFVSPGYMTTLYTNPTGANLIAAAIGALVLAHIVIRKIVDIEI